MRLSKIARVIAMIAVMFTLVFSGLPAAAEDGDEIVAAAPIQQSELSQILVVCFVGVGTMAYGAFMIMRAEE